MSAWQTIIFCSDSFFSSFYAVIGDRQTKLSQTFSHVQ